MVQGESDKPSAEKSKENVNAFGQGSPADEFKALIVKYQEEHFQGPIPPPDELKQYEEVFPGLGEKIVGTWISEAEHRRAMENRLLALDERSIETDGRLQLRGQIFAFMVALLALGVGAYLAGSGHITAGMTLLLSNLIGLAAVYLGARWRRAKEEALESEAETTD